MKASQDKQDPNEVNMKSLSEWREGGQFNEMGLRDAGSNRSAPMDIGQQTMAPMDIVRQTMARIAPLVTQAHDRIAAWPVLEEREKASRTLDEQLLKASRDQWMGKAKMASQGMSRGMDAAKAMKRFGGMSSTAANNLAI